jgi:hypothetical protein
MTDIGWFWEIVNWLALPILAVLAGFLVWRGLHREFPFFFWFVVVTDILTLLRFMAQFSSQRTYFYAYWVSDLVITIFNFLAVYELFVRRLFPRFFKTRFFRYLFPAVAAVIIFFGWLTALESPNRNAAFLIEARVLDFVLVAMLAFFVGLMILMGRQWTRHDFGIALGFGINSAAFLFASAMWVRTHYRPTSVDHLPLIAYDLTCLIWLYCFWTAPKTPVSLASPHLPQEALREAQKWETVLKDFITPDKR